VLKLIIEDDEGRKTVVPFVRDEITIGRQEGNTIRLTERNVSRRHARLVRQNGHVLVEDLGSYNGIRINGDKIQGQVPVHEGDLIQIGDYDLAVQQEGQQATSSTVPLTAVANAHATNGETGLEKTSPRLGSNGNASSAMTVKLPDLGATSPALPVVSDASATLGGDEEDDGPEEADPDDVQSASGESETARRQSTAIIRMDQVDGNRPRQIVDIDPTEAPRLVVLNTDFAGREFACIRSELKIGRTEDNDIAIDHRSLSRTHCKIVREDTGEWRVVDMQSANGLMVNGEPYAQSALRTGDTLELGHVKFKFVGPGEAFTLSTTAEGVAVRQGGSKAPVVAAGVAVFLGIALAGYWFVFRKKPVVPPIEVHVENPIRDPIAVVKPPEPPKPVEPVELTPEQKNAEREKKILQANQLIEAGDWAAAGDILKTCFVGESPCPETTRLMGQMQAEKGMKAALEAAEAALDAGDLVKAKQQLDAANSGKLLRKRYEVAANRYKSDTAHELAVKQANAAKPPEPKPPEPKPPPEPPRPPPVAVDNKEAEVQALITDAKALMKEKQFPSARTKLDKCIKAQPKNPDCHKLLGTVWAKQNESDKGAAEYRLFLKYASPDSPDIEKVKAILETFEHPSK
jgi:pSer/pThr/pTyr-binding forkhead associated (FHA) protein